MGFEVSDDIEPAQSMRMVRWGISRIRSQAILIVPYDNNTRFTVQRTQAFWFLQVRRSGKYTFGIDTVLEELKDEPITSDRDIRKQHEGYDTLVKHTQSEDELDITCLSAHHLISDSKQDAVEDAANFHKTLYAKDSVGLVALIASNYYQLVHQLGFDRYTRDGAENSRLDRAVRLYFNTHSQLWKIFLQQRPELSRLEGKPYVGTALLDQARAPKGDLLLYAVPKEKAA